MKPRVEERQGLQGVGGNGPHGAGGDGIGLVEGGEQGQAHAALVEEIDAAAILDVLIGVDGPQAVAFGFGEDEVVDFRLDGDAHGARRPFWD